MPTIFGYPGDGINRAGDRCEFVQVRHEEKMAAFMASAYAKFSSRLGVCLATSGPDNSAMVDSRDD